MIFQIQGRNLFTVFSVVDFAQSDRGSGSVHNPDSAGIAAANALLLAYQYNSRPGATFRFSYSGTSPTGSTREYLLLGNFVGGDYLGSKT